MADDGEISNNPRSHRTQETFQRGQDHRFPNRGPKKVVIRREGDSFGFTLRHFIVYPPDSISKDNDDRYAAVGALSTPMDTIFVKHVKESGPAKKAGLRQGDRLIKVNDVVVTNKSYSQVIHFIQTTPGLLHLLVVPKEDDILQRYFADSAYNPVSNQDAPRLLDRAAAQSFLTQTIHPHLQIDAISWRSLQHTYDPAFPVARPPRSADNLDDPAFKRARPRAQPQTASKNMGRRASDGCTLETDLSESEAVFRKPGCRFSFNERQESASSLASSYADSSLMSFDSNSTLTMDDSAMVRVKKSVQQKEEFLRGVGQKEFHSRPRKIEGAVWPPPVESPSKLKPTHQNFQRVKDEIRNERDLIKVKENGEQQLDEINGSKDYFQYPRSQVVQTKARQFESGQVEDRTNAYRSELALLSSTNLVPNVTERVQEYDSRSTQNNRIQRDTKSLESSDSGSSVVEVSPRTLSGNVTISTGSKYIHCPPPSELGRQPTESLVSPKVYVRSSSADSWLADSPTSKAGNKISRQDAISDDGNKTSDHHEDVSGDKIPYADLPSLIPESVENLHFIPSVSITPAPPLRAIRPNQLNLEGPVRPARHLKPPALNIESPVIGDVKSVVKRRTKSTNISDDDRITRRESYLKATETGRMHIDNDLSDGDTSHALRSSHKRWRPPLFPDDIRQLRKLFEDAANILGGSSSSSASLEREKNNLIKDGLLHTKITEIDGKRSSDRSWKQIWASLRGPKLFLYKDKNHQSPADAIDPSMCNGVDMRASEVRVAEDYTKRKHVLRVSSAKPSSEFLLQAENTEELTDWLKALQEQIATDTEAEAEFDPMNNTKQQAVPQTTPATTSILTSSLAKTKPLAPRNRSPSGQSPSSKTRRATHTSELSNASPKSKPWFGGRFGKQKKGTSPSSPTAPDGSTFGVPLEHCLPSATNPYVPKFVEVCTNIVDEKGLQILGIYRVPGNSTSITALCDEVNRCYDDVPMDDPRWNDLHVVSSLLKAYFRRIPDSLVTTHLYPSFIQADKIENAESRMKELKRLIKRLPPHNYHTLKHVIFHLKNVVDNADVNKMEAKNLAIVFGPNIVRTEDENMENMVHNMTHQCKIVESLLTAADWFFGEDDSQPIPLALTEKIEDVEPTNHAVLLDNIGKCEALKDKEKNGALLSSILSAAQRKVKRKTKGSCSLNESKEEVISPNDTISFSYDLKDGVDKSNVIPTTVSDIEKVTKTPPEKVPWFNYSSDKEDFYKRIETFKQETQAMLQMPRHVQISVNNIPSKSLDSQLMKTNSASNVFARTYNTDNRRSVDNSYQVQCTNKSDSGFNRDTNRNELTKFTTRRGGSVENVSTDLNANGTMKKPKYEIEGEIGQRMGSLDSLNRVTADDATDLTSVLTLLDKKLNKENLLSGEGIPYVDQSPEKTPTTNSFSDKENVLDPSDLYRNPSLHKSSRQNYHHDSDKDEDSTMLLEKIKPLLKRSESLNKTEKNAVSNKVKRSESLKRSDSLTKTEKTESNNKRRESSIRRGKDVMKLKRKNGMPDRSIKRRHTVGGTKDPDKVTWFDNKKHEAELTESKERTSSPDLSSARRERLFHELNRIGPENMVMALRQHLIGARPQSFPDTAVFQLPLESHV